MEQNKNTKRFLILLIILIALFILGWFFLACNPVIALWLDRVPQRCQYNFVPISLTSTSTPTKPSTPIKPSAPIKIPTPTKPSTPTAPVVIKGEVNIKPTINSFTVAPNPRTDPNYAYLSWQTVNARSCQLNGGRFTNTLVETASSSVPVAPEVPERTFTLTCFNGVGGQGTSSVSASVLVKSLFTSNPSSSVSNNSIYTVTNGASQDVKIIRRVSFSGQLLKEWQVKSSNGEALKLFGFNFMGQNDNLLLLAFTPSLSWLETFSPEGVSLKKVVLPNGSGKIVSPKDVDQDSGGNVYVLQASDYSANQIPAIIKFSSEGQFVKSFGLANSIVGRSGSKVDSIGYPVSLVIVGDNIYVGDYGFGSYVHRFKTSGDYVSHWGVPCTFDKNNSCINIKPTGDGVFNYPWLIRREGDNQSFYLNDSTIPLAPGTTRFDNTATNFVQKFDLTGKFVSHVVTRKGSNSYIYKTYLGPCCTKVLATAEGSTYLFSIDSIGNFYFGDSTRRVWASYSSAGELLNNLTYDTLFGKGKIGDVLTVAAD